MKKDKELAFFCQSCGHHERKWHGRCPACEAWNTMVEERFSENAREKVHVADKAEAIINIKESAITRLPIGIPELDRVLGGGLVPGGVTLIGGEPGSGKSTLLQMAAGNLAKSKKKVLYVSGEESKEQFDYQQSA